MARLGSVNKKYDKVTQNTRNFKPYLLVGITSLCCYLNSLFGEFVYDDYEVIETNADLRLVKRILACNFKLFVYNSMVNPQAVSRVLHVKLTATGLKVKKRSN